MQPKSYVSHCCFRHARAPLQQACQGHFYCVVRTIGSVPLKVLVVGKQVRIGTHGFAHAITKKSGIRHLSDSKQVCLYISARLLKFLHASAYGAQRVNIALHKHD